MSDLLSFDENGVQFAWDATSVSNYAKCPRYYKWVNLEGWQPLETSVHLLFGGWYAKALEEFYVLRAEGKTHDEALNEIVYRTLIRTWNYEYAPDDNIDRDRDHWKAQVIDGIEPIEDNGPWESLHNTKTRETLIRSIVWYFEEFGEDDNTKVMIVNGEPAVELSFSLPLYDDILYCGHIDRGVIFGDDKFAMDQKTSGATISKRFFEGFSPDYQMSGYVFAGSIMWDTHISGVIIDAAQIAVGFTAFTRGFVHKPPQVIAEWREDVIALIKRAREDTANDHFIPNFTACDKYGGCQFRKICARAPEHRERALSVDFTRKARWDPLKQR